MDNAQAIWTAKSDDELVEAAEELFEFTEEGERIVRSELRRRGLDEPDPPIGKCSRCGRSIAANHPGEQCSECEEPFPPEILRKLKHDDDAPEPRLVSVLRTEDPGLVPVAKAMLDEEGIEHLVRGGSGQGPFDGIGRGPVEFLVHEEDEEDARSLLAELGATAREGSLRDQLLGHWALVSVAAVNGSEITYPIGQDVEGVITYEPSGRMAVQIMRRDRPQFASGDVERGTPEELSAAIGGYTAYFGTFSVDEDAGVVTHHVKGSLFPNWVGTDQRREIEFERDRLTLTSQPILFEGKTQVFRVVWKRDQNV